MNKMDIIARFLTDNVVWLTIVIAFVSVASYLVGRFSGYLYWLSPGLKKVAIIPQLTPLMEEAFGDKSDKSDNIRKFVFINQLAKQAEKALKADWLAEENEHLREQIAELEGKIKSKSEGGHKPPRDMDLNKLRETVLNGSKTPVHELMVKGADPLVLSHDEAVKAGLPFAMEDADLHRPPTLGNPCKLTSREKPAKNEPPASTDDSVKAEIFDGRAIVEELATHTVDIGREPPPPVPDVAEMLGETGPAYVKLPPGVVPLDEETLTSGTLEEALSNVRLEGAVDVTPANEPSTGDGLSSEALWRAAKAVKADPQDSEWPLDDAPVKDDPSSKK